MNILVIYATQSGQLRSILDRLMTDMIPEAHVDFAEIELLQPYPFPWSSDRFFDAMPECVLEIPSAIKPMPQILERAYDLVILGYQPWFLSPSNPTTSFLKSEWAKALQGKPVITVIGCRNMWLNGQEKVKAALLGLQAQLVGNIVLEDRHSNLVALLTIIRWMFKGQKKASGWLPDAGVSDEEILASKRFGAPILQHYRQNNLSQLQDTLLKMDAVILRPNLIIIERRGAGQFPHWAMKARNQGLPGNKERMKVIMNFKRLLLVSIFVLSPISALLAKIQVAFQHKKLKREVDYFKNVQFEPGRIGIQNEAAKTG